ncbi:FtsX-like permease family protein [Shewanella sp. M16]|jgi:putative ABC transport system permease protein|uniref:FtsX-like permease family protein n=1 Tax=Shewanella TaxID=22 RepID=UPI00048E518D|nr:MULTISPECIES: FtsX-like permease family protein [unclassified Shewanella]MBP8119083.1 FtsX-like permease family protein [Shewanella sp.]MBI1672913.1 FtsX-like permease family protein [Shewanella sp. DW31]MBS0040885.1 FtsX-like permease family protein [Shewanella sp. M16]MBW3531360.1 FtsX-like permease family protein [Shewanella sp. NKUCC06_TVS]MCU8006241.1 FtsX-like permease family protein [Shewanella sp. SM87]
MLHIKPILSSLLRSKSGPVLLLIQIILSVAIVANASFIIQERLALMQRDSGIKESEVLTFSLFNFDPLIDKTAQNKIDQQILRGLPNVIDATSTNMLPLSGGGWSSTLNLGPDPDSAKSTPQFAMYLGTDHTIETLGIKLIEGRNFYPHELKDNLDSPSRLAIISSVLAKAIWPDESALGKVLYEGKDAQITVIGVVEKLQGAWIDSSSLENSVIQNVDYGSSSYMVRAKPEFHAELKDAIKKALLAENPNRVLDGFKSIEALKDSSYRDHKLMITVLTMMVVLLLLITSLGLTGMVMFNIQRRTKQIGTRRALGAKKRDIISYFLVENYLICLAGGVLGGLLAIQLGQQLMKIYSLPMLDLSYPLITVAGLFIVTTLAVYLPARKAANISPATATRSV